MNELLKVYVQTNREIPLEQLIKLDNNLLKTYYRYNKKYIESQIFSFNEYLNVFYNILDDETKNKVYDYIARRDITLTNINANIIKDYFIANREIIEKFLIKTIPYGEKYMKYVKSYYAVLDSDIKKILENKLIAHFHEKSQDPEISYFAKELLNKINEMGFDEFIDAINYRLNSGDISKRIMFLLYIIDDFDVNNPTKMNDYIDVIDTEDMTEIIEQNCTNELKRQKFIYGSSFAIQNKFPQIFVDMVMRHENEELLLFLPTEFIFSNDLGKKFSKIIYKISINIWNRMKNDSLNDDGTINKKKLEKSVEYNYYDYVDKRIKTHWEVVNLIGKYLKEIFQRTFKI